MDPLKHGFFGALYFSPSRREEVGDITRHIETWSPGAEKLEIPPPLAGRNPLYRPISRSRAMGYEMAGATLFNQLLFQFHFLPLGSGGSADAGDKWRALVQKTAQLFPNPFIGASLLTLGRGSESRFNTPFGPLIWGSLTTAPGPSDGEFHLATGDSAPPPAEVVWPMFPMLDLPRLFIANLIKKTDEKLAILRSDLTAMEKFILHTATAIGERDKKYPGDRIGELEFLADAVPRLEAGLKEMEGLVSLGERWSALYQQTRGSLLAFDPKIGKTSRCLIDDAITQLLEKKEQGIDTIKRGHDIFNSGRDLLFSLTSAMDLDEISALIHLLHFQNPDNPTEFKKVLSALLVELGLERELLKRILGLMRRLPPVTLPTKFPGATPGEVVRLFAANCEKTGGRLPRETEILRKLSRAFGLAPEESVKILGPDVPVKPPPVSPRSAIKREGPLNAFIGSALMSMGGNQMLDLALHELEAKRYESAKGFFKKILMVLPDNGDAILYLARCYFYLGEYDKCLGNLKLLAGKGGKLETGSALYADLCRLYKKEKPTLDLANFQPTGWPLDDLILYADLLQENGVEASANRLYDELLTPDLLARRFPPRYQVRKLLGEGGMGIVYLAHDEVLDIDVALKLVRPRFARNRELIESLLKEARIMAVLNSHPSTVQVYDIETKGIPYIVMAVLKGGSLRDWIKEKGPLTSAHIKSLGAEVLSVLTFAHEDPALGIIHRDIKPENIMIDEKGHAYVTDFGLAEFEKEVEVNERVTGTPAYMAPEQFRGQSIDHRADIYAFGIMVYELITGHFPFAGAFFRKVVMEAEPPEKFKPGLDEKWSTLIKKCIARDPANRYSTVRELTRDWDQLPAF